MGEACARHAMCESALNVFETKVVEKCAARECVRASLVFVEMLKKNEQPNYDD